MKTTRFISAFGLALSIMLLVPGCPATGGLDSDGDGFPDEVEINGVPGTDPNNANDNPNNVIDTDGDGCSDFDESNFEGFCDNDPNTGGAGQDGTDSDGDGFSDNEEINGIPGTDPNDPTDNPNNVRDTDGDGCSDFDELNFQGFCNNDPNVNDGSAPPDAGGDTVSITGAVTINASSVVDGDTRDPLNPVIPNNADNGDLTRVQAIPNPAVLGGFLGTLDSSTDAFDVYRVQMAAGQSATLLLANPTVNDFDLFLFDGAGELLDSSEGVDKAEQVVAPSNGTFLVQVYGFSVDNNGDAGGLYTLLIGQSPLGTSSVLTDKLSSLHDHAEGEVLVKFKEGVKAPPAKSLSSRYELERVNSADNAIGVERLRVLGDQADETNLASKTNRAPLGSAQNALDRPDSAAIAAVKELRRRDDVEYAEPNYIRQALAVPNDEFFNLQWHYPQISLPEAWDITTGDSSVIVAILDTGILLNHPDMQGQLVNGFDMISDPSIARDGDGIDANPNDPGDLAINGTTSTFHGTHVGGTVAARSNNGEGVAGVAWDVKLMPVRVLGVGGGTDFDIVQGILFAAGLSNSSGTVPAQRADIINMSLGGPGISQAEQSAISDARAAGVIVVAAAGNESSNADFSSPAGLDGVVTVSSVGFTRALAPYSNFGSSVEVAAPGGDMSADANGDTYGDGVLSTLGTDNGGFVYDFSQGTSMASPHVAGVAALMKSVNPNMTPEDFDQLLAGTHPQTNISIVDDLGSPGKDQSFGYGLINAFNAVRAASEIGGGNAVDRPLLRVQPTNLDFGNDQTSADLVATNSGTDTLTVTSVTTSESWLSVTPTSGGAGTYQASVDRSGLDDGIFTGSITFESNGGTVTVSVRMVVGEVQQGGGDVGAVYVLVVDLDNLATVDQFNANAAGGYAFSFTNLPVGSYGLFAGTDLNNDTSISDEGEALGGYPTLLDPQPLVANQDRSGIGFGVSYTVNVQTPTSAATSETRAQRLPLRKRSFD